MESMKASVLSRAESRRLGWEFVKGTRGTPGLSLATQLGTTQVPPLSQLCPTYLWPSHKDFSDVTACLIHSTAKHGYRTFFLSTSTY